MACCLLYEVSEGQNVEAEADRLVYKNIRCALELDEWSGMRWLALLLHERAPFIAVTSILASAYLVLAHTIGD